MAIAAVPGQAGKVADTSFSAGFVDRAFGSNVSVGSLILVFGFRQQDAAAAFTSSNVAKQAGTATIDTVVMDRTELVDVNGTDRISTAVWSCLVTGAGSLTMRLTAPAGGTYKGLTIVSDEYTGSFDGSRAEAGNSASTATDSQTTASSGNATSAGAGMFVGSFLDYSAVNAGIGQDGAYTVIAEEEDGTTSVRGSAIRQIVGSGTTDSADWTMGSSNSGWACLVQVYKEASSSANNQTFLWRG